MTARARYIVGPAYDGAFFLLPPLGALLAGIAISGTALSNETFRLLGARRPVPLTWDVRRRRFGGRVRGITVVQGPCDVHLTIGTQLWSGHIAAIVLAPAVAVSVHTTRVVEVVEVHTHRKHRKHRKHRHHGVVVEIR